MWPEKQMRNLILLKSSYTDDSTRNDVSGLRSGSIAMWSSASGNICAIKKLNLWTFSPQLLSLFFYYYYSQQLSLTGTSEFDLFWESQCCSTWMSIAPVFFAGLGVFKLRKGKAHKKPAWVQNPFSKGAKLVKLENENF